MPDLSVTDIIKFSGLLLQAGLDVYKTQAENEGKTLDEILSAADLKWKAARSEGEDLQKLGHE
jgi:hypothetical protein